MKNIIHYYLIIMEDKFWRFFFNFLFDSKKAQLKPVLIFVAKRIMNLSDSIVILSKKNKYVEKKFKIYLSKEIIELEMKLKGE